MGLLKNVHMLRSTFLIFFVLILLVGVKADAARTSWKSIRKGLEHTSIKINTGAIHAFRINLDNYKLGVITAKDLARESSPVKDMAIKSRALVAVNGGFFTPEYRSLGLLINNSKVVNPLKNTSWWSVFFVKGETPYIVHTNSFQMDLAISVALQSGPRLVVDGNIPNLKPSFAERSAVCVNEKKNVIIVVTENVVMQTNELAAYLQRSEGEGGFGCRDALNLDGGSSTQLYSKVGSFELDVPGINTVANALAVYAK